jgi:hypothetical protein
MRDLIDKLRGLPGANLSEVCEKHTFECYRVRGDGCMQEVTVVILDAGPNVQGSPRFFVHATSAEGRTVAGRADSSLDAVLESVKWSDLDPEELWSATVPPAASDVPGPGEPPTRDEYDRRDLFDKIRKRLASK